MTTTEGSITAYVRAETGEFQRDMAAAQAVIDDVRKSDPTVTVHANVAEALAKIEAVREEASSVQAGFDSYSMGQRGAPLSSDLAVLKQQIRDLQLPQTYYTNDLATAQGRLAAAKRAVASADRDLFSADVVVQNLMEHQTPTLSALRKGYDDLASASARYRGAQAALAAAEAGVADLGPTPPSDTTPKAPANGGNGNAPAGRYALIAGVVAGLLPMAADLAGFLAADAGAFAGMGAAGVLAVAGIKSEMQSGSAVGHMYTSLIQSVTDDLGTLEATAAKGVLTGFEASVQAVNNAMPALNQEVGLFSAGLGRVAAMSVDGLVTGIQVLNPLFLQGQGYLLGLVADFDQWTHSSTGLAQWAADAQRTFPLVADTVGTLAQTIMQLIGDLAPLGSAMLGALDIAMHIADFLTSVLGPAFGPVTLGVVASVLAFQNFSTIAPILDAVTGGVFALSGAQDVAAASADALAASETAVEVAAGPAGWVMLAASAAVGVLTGALVLGAQAAGQAATAQANYTSQVQQDSGVIGAATQKYLAQNLVTAGAIDQAKQLGISTAEVTAAIEQGGTARSTLISHLGKIAAANTTVIGTGRSYHIVANQDAQTAKDLTATVLSQSGAVDAATSAYRKQNATLVTLAIQAQQQITQQGALQLNYGLTAAQVSAASDEQSNLAAQTAFVSAQLGIENTAAQNLQAQLNLMNNGALGLAEAQTAAGAATNSLTGALKKNHDAIRGNSAAAIADQQALQQKVQADQAVAAAVAKATGSQDKGNASLLRSRDALEAQLRKLGLLTPAVKRYIEEIDRIPKSVSTTITLHANTQQALAAVNNAIAGATVAGGVTGAKYYHADGGPIYRDGGGPAWAVPKGTDTIPAMLTPGEFVVKQKSAAYNPQFLKAYNADPERAIASIAPSQSVPSTLVVVDVDGALIGRMRVEARATAQQQSAGRTAALMAGRSV